MTADQPVQADPLAAIPSPEAIRLMLADLSRRRELLRSLLRTSVRIEKYPPPQQPSRREVAHAA